MKRQVVLKTNMIDTAIETYPDNEIPSELLKRRDEVLKDRDMLKSKCDPVVEILEKDEVKEQMDNSRDREGNSKLYEFIEKEYNVCFYLVLVSNNNF